MRGRRLHRWITQGYWAIFFLLLGPHSLSVHAVSLNDIMAQKEKDAQQQSQHHGAAPGSAQGAAQGVDNRDSTLSPAAPGAMSVRALDLILQPQPQHSADAAVTPNAELSAPLAAEAPSDKAEPAGQLAQDGPSGEPFSTKVVEQKIQDDLKAEFGENLEVRFAPWKLPGRSSRDITKFIVEEMQVNDKRTKLTALVHFDVAGELVSLRLRGNLEHMISVPALNRVVQFGEVIAKEDITWISLSGRQSNRYLITKEEDLIGRQPRTGILKPGVPLQQRDIERVRDVQKGSMIVGRYQTEQLDLSTKVRALEHGSLGDNIRVLNVESNKILYGVVVGPGEISLSPVAVQPPEEKRAPKSKTAKSPSLKTAARDQKPLALEPVGDGEFDLALRKDAQSPTEQDQDDATDEE